MFEYASASSYPRILLSVVVPIFLISNVFVSVATLPTERYYANITLQSSEVTVNVYLPQQSTRICDGTPDNNETLSSSCNDYYYQSSRFEHGSMIGPIIRNSDKRTMYDGCLWRSSPHDPFWTESGIGLASEFGCGDDGVLCSPMVKQSSLASPPSSVARASEEEEDGGRMKNAITNGVLGYEEARAGEEFLKIGVGALIKGSCLDCVDGNDDDLYRFNSPYRFVRPPVWKVLKDVDDDDSGIATIVMVHEENLGDRFGYRIKKTVRLLGNILTIGTELTNLGKERFVTPWYSHHFFDVDGIPIGPGYGVDLSLSRVGGAEEAAELYKEPGVQSWSTPIADYATVKKARGGREITKVSLIREVEDDSVKIKAEFLNDGDGVNTDASFTLYGPGGVSITEMIPEVQTGDGMNLSMYAYNLYIERGTLSPEPLLVVAVAPAETSAWTQHLQIHKGEKIMGAVAIAGAGAAVRDRHSPVIFFCYGAASVMISIVVIAFPMKMRRRFYKRLI